MTVDTCARYLDRTPKAIRALVARQLIPVTRKAGRLYFDRVRIDQWMETCP
jgi:hypothetical protein